MNYIIIFLIFVVGLGLALYQLPKLKNHKQSNFTLVSAGLIIIFSVLTMIKECNNQVSSETNEALINNTNRNSDTTKTEVKKLREEIGLGADPYNVTKNGFSFYLILEYSEVTDFRRKFLFDLGESEQFNRVSLYFDIDNNIIFRIIDKNGESFICKAPRLAYVFNPNSPFIIYADCGTSQGYSFMRLLINGQEVFRNSSNSEIEFLGKAFTDTTKSTVYGYRRLNEFIKPQRFVTSQLRGSVLADMNGQNKSEFYFYEFVITGGIYDKEKIDAIWYNARNNMKYYQRIKELLKFEKTYYQFKYGKLEAVK